MSNSQVDWDVIIIGAGPAGLSAALVLGRCCRRVLVCDAGTPRNWATKKMHAFLSRDGICPDEFRAIAREQLSQYGTVEYREARIEDVVRSKNGFKVSLPDGRVSCRKLLLATGLMDELPEIAGLRDFFGVSVFQCPYCDAWEWRHSPIAVYGRGKGAFELCRAMTAWTSDLVLLSDGSAELSDSEKAELLANHVRVEEARIERLEGADGKLEAIVFRDGSKLARRVLFFEMPSHEQSPLARNLGCSFTDAGGIDCGDCEATCVPGLYVAGNIVKDVQLAIVAAAEGAKAAFGINRAMTREDFASRADDLKE